jgi:diaminopimelate decarboxylase
MFPEWALRLTTPTLIYDLSRLNKSIHQFRELCEKFNIVCCYSVKANRNPTILKILAQECIGADVASYAEFSTARQYGLMPVVSTGPGMSIELMKGVAEQGGTIFFDHVDQVTLAIKAGIALDNHGIRISIPGDYSRFGFNSEELSEIYKLGFYPRKVHAHAGEIISTNHLKERLDTLSNFCNTFKPEVIDIGGGFAMLSNSNEHLHNAFDILSSFAKVMEAQLIIEPGKAIIARSGMLLATVLTSKRRGSCQVAVIDASSFNLGQMEPRQLWATSSVGTESILTMFMGPTCYEGDIWGKFPSQHLRPGDRVIFSAMGAYTTSIAATLHEMPPIPEVFFSKIQLGSNPGTS